MAGRDAPDGGRRAHPRGLAAWLRRTLGRTVFWRVAGVLVGVQVATGLLAVGLSAVLAQGRSLELVRGTLQLRLDQIADEVEQRAVFDAFGNIRLPEPLRVDLGTRLPDPFDLLDAEGDRVASFGRAPGAPPLALPDEAEDALVGGDLRVVLSGPEGSWALVPLLAPDGLPAGALFVRPLDATVAEEMRGTREAFVRATVATALLAAVLALLLGALFTWRLVRPLRRMTRRVEALGAGDYSARLPDEGEDELGRLGAAINDMAAQVARSVDELRATDRLRRELVANVGHDLRTPLAALQAYLEEADRTAAAGDAARAADYVAAARRQAEGVASLVADLF